MRNSQRRALSFKKMFERIDNNIEQAIEVKHADHHAHSALRHFHKNYGFPLLQLVEDLKQEKLDNGIPIVSAASFLRNLYL